MAPGFWFQPPGGLLRRLGKLAPGRRAPPPLTAPAFLVAVRPLTAGATGNTAAVIALAQRLAMRGRRVQIVTPGSGAGRQVDARRDRPGETRDTALLFAAFAPTWTGDLAACLAAASPGADVVLLDAPQTVPAVAALTIATADATRGIGNGLAWPLGPLAAPLGRVLASTDLVLATDSTAPRARPLDLPCPVLPAPFLPLETGLDWAGLEVIAFAGDAPERLFARLTALGVRLARSIALSPYQPMAPALLQRLQAEARATGAQLVTTERDATQLPQHLRREVLTLPMRLEPADWALIDARLP